MPCGLFGGGGMCPFCPPPPLGSGTVVNNSEFTKLMFAKRRFVITKPLSAPSLVLSVHA